MNQKIYCYSMVDTGNNHAFNCFSEINNNSLLVSLVFFLFAVLEEKTNLLVVKITSRLSLIIVSILILSIIVIRQQIT